MSKYKVEVNAATAQSEQAPAHDAENHDHAHKTDDVVTTAATIGVVAVAAALFEAALIPGLAIGVAAALAPKYLPKLGDRLQPLLHTTVRGAYKLGRKARSAVGEAQEKLSDIAAEVHADEAAKADAKTPSGAAATA